jgi:4-hydroxy-4-methyl-2-oxoglutarate aldolase
LLSHRPRDVPEGFRLTRRAARPTESLSTVHAGLPTPAITAAFPVMPRAPTSTGPADRKRSKNPADSHRVLLRGKNERAEFLRNFGLIPKRQLRPEAALRSKVYLKVDRVDPRTCAAARTVSVSDLHEAMGAVAGRRATLAPAMRALIQGLRMAGPAVTAACAPGDNLMMHRALYLAQAGDVLVVQAPEAGAQWGDMAARYALRKGLAGIVVDGYIRDTDELRAMRSPVWSTRVGPSSPAKSGAGQVNAPIMCAGVRIEPGDLVVADGDGVIAIPRGDAAAVVARAEQRMAREKAHHAEIDAGGELWLLHGCASAYEALDVEEIDAPWHP